jgi:hypothetical protein
MQHPRVTVGWAVSSLERALGDLGDSPEEARVRRQFHQLLLALERDGYTLFDRRVVVPFRQPAEVIPMPTRATPIAS